MAKLLDMTVMAGNFSNAGRKEKSMASEVLKGLPTRTGVAEGNGAMLDKPQGQAFGDNISFKGKILVARMTNPGMIRQIKESEGVACEGGGRTCHAAVVCSEIGKPCVVGVASLMEAFLAQPKPTRMRIDGTQGTVQFVDFKLVED